MKRSRIFLVAMALLSSGAFAAADLPSGAEPLFEAESAALWLGGDRQPVANLMRDGAITLPMGEMTSTRSLGNYELHLDFMLSAPEARLAIDLGGGATIELSGSQGRPLTQESSGALRGVKAPVMDAARAAGQAQSLAVSYTRYAGRAAIVSAWLNGRRIHDRVTLPQLPEAPAKKDSGSGEVDREANSPWFVADAKTSASVDLAKGFTVVSRFRTKAGGTLFAKANAKDKWVPNGKALFIRGGRLVYDIGWEGALTAEGRVNDGAWHLVVLSSDAKGRSVLAVDGDVVGSKTLHRPDGDGHRLKIGQASTNFGGLFQGEIEYVKLYGEPTDAKQAAQISDGKAEGPGAPRWTWKDDGRHGSAPKKKPQPWLSAAAGVAQAPISLRVEGAEIRVTEAWVRPLASVDHARFLSGLDELAMQRGAAIYNNLCVNCHGNDGRTPPLPVARAFGVGPFNFGDDPVSMFTTLTEGRGLMGPQTWMTEQERYDVIHYIRETFMKPMYPAYQPINTAYLSQLPHGVAETPEAAGKKTLRDFGPALASQFEKRVVSALTVKLAEEMSIAYDLHTMAQIDVWSGGFLDLGATQHHRLRGEGQPRAAGSSIAGLSGWRWGHQASLDFAAKNKPPRGPMPSGQMDYRGYHLHGDRLVFEYAIDGRAVLELPEKQKGLEAMVHTLRLEPGEPLVLAVAKPAQPGVVAGVVPLGKAEPIGLRGEASGTLAMSAQKTAEGLGAFTAAAAVGETQGLTWTVDEAHGLVLHLPKADRARVIRILRYAGQGTAGWQSFDGLVRHTMATGSLEDPKTLTEGGPLRWAEVLQSTGVVSADNAPYVLETLTLPSTNPWNSWFRTSALDFFPDGRMVVTTHGGDVWVVSGVDRSLKDLKWKRFASGLYEPFGVKVIDEKVYVTCKDRLVRLHDRNGDGEADFYESFSADTDVSIFFHAYNFDLQVDGAGNLYYAKAGQYTDHALPGAVIKISPDGKQREVYCTGFRTPNGMGMMPDGRPTVSDNQGSWMPASKVSLCNPGGFYGYVQTHASPGNWAPDGGRIDPKKVVPPDTFDQPIIWMPQEFDNSSGGQLYVDDARWGPLSNRLLHTSFGKGWLYYFMLQEVDGLTQSAIVKMPLDFETGIHRARVNPADGQVYATGLNGWNGGGRKGLTEGGIQRVRYTGKSARLLTDVQVRPGGLELTFNFDLDPSSAANMASYAIKQWNYKWTAGYGSAQWSVRHPDQKGTDPVDVKSAQVLEGGRRVFLSIPEIRPADQIHMQLDLKSVDGVRFEQEVYQTILRVPKS